MFQEDLLAQLRKRRAKEDMTILMMETDEDVIAGAMCKQFVKDYLKMREVVYFQTNVRGPKT
jgi:hypothetical protein